MMTPAFSRLDYLIGAIIDDGDYPQSVLEARSELAQLRATVAALTDSLKNWADLWTHINNRLGYADGDLLPNASNFDYLIEQCGNWSHNLPNQVTTAERDAAYRRGWCDAREAAAKVIDYKEIDSDNPQFNLIADRDDEMSASIRAMQPPTAPTEHDAESHQHDAISAIDNALSVGYTRITETPLDGYGREVLESIKRDIDDNRAATLEAWHERM